MMLAEITFTIDGRPFIEIAGLITDPTDINLNSVALFIRNIFASLNGKSVTCTTVLDTEDMALCTVLKLPVQGKS